MLRARGLAALARGTALASDGLCTASLSVQLRDLQVPTNFTSVRIADRSAVLPRASPLALPPAAAAALRCYSAPTGDSVPAKQVLYKGRGMRLFRVLVRLKVFQLAGVAALAVPITTVLSGAGEVSGLQAVVCASLVVGSGAASTALWFYSRRYVGELSLLRPPPASAAVHQPAAAVRAAPAAASAEQQQQQQQQALPLVRLSVLDFWGNREDNDVSLDRLVPPLGGLPAGARSAVAAEPLLPLDVEGDRQYYISLRYGQLEDAPTLRQLLAGELPEQRALAAAADSAAINAGVPEGGGHLGR